MKKPPTEPADELRPEYDLTQLRGAVRGKYYKRAAADSNIVCIDPELAAIFPTSEAVNRALRLLVEAAQSATPTKKRKRA